jgi:hypothetical protein
MSRYRSITGTRTDRQTRGVVQILVPGEPAVDRLPQEGRQLVLRVHAGPAVAEQALRHRRQPQRVVELGGDRASLAILPAEAAGLRGMRPKKGNGHLVDRCRGYTVVARSSGALTYVATGRCPEERLMRLMPPAGPATDPATGPAGEPTAEPEPEGVEG